MRTFSGRKTKEVFQYLGVQVVFFRSNSVDYFGSHHYGSCKCRREHVFPVKNLHRCNWLPRNSLRHLEKVVLPILGGNLYEGFHGTFRGLLRVSRREKGWKPLGKGTWKFISRPQRLFSDSARFAHCTADLGRMVMGIKFTNKMVMEISMFSFQYHYHRNGNENSITIAMVSQNSITVVMVMES